MKKQNIHLITFADSRMHLAAERLVNQAKEMEIFDTIQSFDESSLKDPELEPWKHYLTSSTRGYGYYCWKSYLISRELNKLNGDDILFYLDAGCHLNVQGRTRFFDYIQMLNEDELGIKLFPVNETYHLRPCIEQEWTKNDLFVYFNCLDRADILTSDQLAATHLFIRHCPSAIEFIKKWKQSWMDCFSLIDDSPSLTPNHPNFIEHRHDQSILSILYKITGGKPLPNHECWTPGSWDALKNYPIWDMRDRGQYTRPLIWLWFWKFASFIPYPKLHSKAKSKISNRLTRQPYLKKYFKA